MKRVSEVGREGSLFHITRLTTFIWRRKIKEGRGREERVGVGEEGEEWERN